MQPPVAEVQREGNSPIAAVARGNCLYLGSLEPFVVDSLVTREQSRHQERLDAVAHRQLPKSSRHTPVTLLSEVYNAPCAALHSALLSSACTDEASPPTCGGAAEFHTCTLWGMQYERRYSLCVTLSGRGVPETLSVAALTDDPRGELAEAQSDGSDVVEWCFAREVLTHPQFAEWPSAMGREAAMLLAAPNWVIAEVIPLFPLILRQGLFPLPSQINDEPVAYVFNLIVDPNPFLLDLRQSAAALSASAVPKFPWRRNRKLRRAAASCRYAVAVRESPADIEAALLRCAAYHEAAGSGEWLYADMIRALVATAAGATLASATSGDASSSPPHTRLRMLCFDVVDRATGEVLSGCCGLALGSAYHDYSMYTVRRNGPENFGHLVTKLVGEALDCCGYDMWYMGQRNDYLATYEGRYGAGQMSREEFLPRFHTARDIPAAGDIVEFVRSGRAILPCYALAQAG